MTFTADQAVTVSHEYEGGWDGRTILWGTVSPTRANTEGKRGGGYIFPLITNHPDWRFT